MTTNIDLDALQALAEKATPGQWKKSKGDWAEVEITTAQRIKESRAPICGMEVSYTGKHGEEQRANARFIAAANPQTILSLITRIRDLERRAGASAWQPMTDEEINGLLIACCDANNNFDALSFARSIEGHCCPSAVRAAPDGGKEGGMA